MYTLNIEYDDETDDEVCREKKKKRRNNNNNSTFEKQIRLLMTELKEEKKLYLYEKKINLPNYCNRPPILVLMFPRHSCSHLREAMKTVPHCLNRS
jgi:hypothetical protein